MSKLPDKFEDLAAILSPRAIRTEEENDQTLKMIDQLLLIPEEKRTEEQELYLETISILVHAFEKEYYNFDNPKPITIEEANDILRKVTAILKEGSFFQIRSNKIDGNWLFIEIVPTNPKGRASQYADFLAKMEQKIRKEHDNVHIVPMFE